MSELRHFELYVRQLVSVEEFESYTPSQCTLHLNISGDDTKFTIEIMRATGFQVQYSACSTIEQC